MVTLETTGYWSCSDKLPVDGDYIVCLGCDSNLHFTCSGRQDIKPSNSGQCLQWYFINTMKVSVSAVSLLIVVLATNSHTAKIPSYIKACSRNDPKLNQCALENSKATFAAIIKGDRKFNIPILDPLIITSMEINQSGLKIQYEDMKLVGLKSATVKAIRIDLKKRREEFDLHVPKLAISFRYKVSGRILVLPITGSGTGGMILTGLPITFAHNFDLKKKQNGKLHMVIKNTTFDSNPTLVTIRMENLFNGDKLLGETMNQFMNENWRELHREIGPSFNAALGQIGEQIYNGLMSIVPYDEVFPERV